MNSFQQWASDYARAFGFDVTTTANWVTLHKDGAAVECMSAKGVQLCCYGPGARLKVFSLVIDSDNGTETHLFTTEAERDARCALIVAKAWSDAKRTDPMPEGWREAYDDLYGPEFWLVTTDHELALPSVFA